MATESKPMDIEEEVDEIDQEIKKPEDEGQVAERELNLLIMGNLTTCFMQQLLETLAFQ